MWQLVRSRPRRDELRQRKAVLTEANRSYAALVVEVDRVGPAGFAHLKQRLRLLKQEYEVEVPERQGERWRRSRLKLSRGSCSATLSRRTSRAP